MIHMILVLASAERSQNSLALDLTAAFAKLWTITRAKGAAASLFDPGGSGDVWRETRLETLLCIDIHRYS